LKVTVSEPESWKRVLEFELGADEVDVLYSEKVKAHKKDIKLPGFRLGKVPLDLIKTRYGQSIRIEAIDELIQKSYKEACESHKINPVSEAKISEMKAPEAGNVAFTIETEIDPPIEIKGYEKLKIKSPVKKIKPADVETAIGELQERMAEYKEVDRPSKKGDLATIEYLSVSIDGEVRTDFKNPTYPIEIGASKLKEFDKELVGQMAGSTVEVTTKFPKDYGVADAAGKSGTFLVKINKIQEKILPEVDDAFAKKVANVETVEAFRDMLRTDLEKQERDRAKNEAYNKAIETLVKNNPFEVPPARIERYIDMLMDEAQKYAKEGVPPQTREEITERYRESGIATIKRIRIVDFIAEKEKIKATQEEVDAQIVKIAEHYNQPFEEVKQSLRKNGQTNRIRDDIREQKTLDFLIGSFDPSEEAE
jgi:trigger factor